MHGVLGVPLRWAAAWRRCCARILLTKVTDTYYVGRCFKKYVLLFCVCVCLCGVGVACQVVLVKSASVQSVLPPLPGFWGLNSGSTASMASALPTEHL